MKHFKSPNGDLYAYEADGSQDHLIPANYVLLSDSEYAQASQAVQEKYLAEQQAIPLTRQELRQRRALAYTTEADPLFFKAQRGEATIEEWQAKVAEIRSRYPYPGDQP